MNRRKFGLKAAEEFAISEGLTRRLRAPRKAKSEMLSDLRLVEFVFEAMGGITAWDMRISKAVQDHPTYHAAGNAVAPGRTNYSPYISRRIRKMRRAARLLMSLDADDLRMAHLGWVRSSSNSLLEAPDRPLEPDPSWKRLRTGQLLPKKGGD